MIRANLASGAGAPLNKGEFIRTGNDSTVVKGDITTTNDTYSTPNEYTASIICTKGYSSLTMHIVTQIKVVGFNDYSDATLLNVEADQALSISYDYLLIYGGNTRTLVFS